MIDNAFGFVVTKLITVEVSIEILGLFNHVDIGEFVRVEGLGQI